MACFAAVSWCCPVVLRAVGPGCNTTLGCHTQHVCLRLHACVDATCRAALLYATFCVALFFVSKIIAVLGARRSMFLGSCCYALFVATLVHVIRPVFILGSMLDGVGAAMLWTSQGNLLTR